MREDEVKAVLASDSWPVNVYGGGARPWRPACGAAILAPALAGLDLDAGSSGRELARADEGRRLRFKAPKTKHGRRTITIPPLDGRRTAEALAGTTRTAVCTRTGQGDRDALVFPTWDWYQGARTRLQKTGQKWMVEARPRSRHALRHTHASSLIAEGMDVLTISRRLGHARRRSRSRFTVTCSRTPTTVRPRVIEALFAKVTSAGLISDGGRVPIGCQFPLLFSRPPPAKCLMLPSVEGWPSGLRHRS